MKKKLFNIVRTTLGDATDQDIRHEANSDKMASLLMANAKKRWLIDYQQDREKKREYIKQNLIAEGIDVELLLKKLEETKSK
jgi:hypothetical protein